MFQKVISFIFFAALICVYSKLNITAVVGKVRGESTEVSPFHRIFFFTKDNLLQQRVITHSFDSSDSITGVIYLDKGIEKFSLGSILFKDLEIIEVQLKFPNLVSKIEQVDSYLLDSSDLFRTVRFDYRIFWKDVKQDYDKIAVAYLIKFKSNEKDT
ncbi:hypothetical protein D6810_01315 [Candidatus Dojkabacteria bacterium]|uniref:Uncharacterized protein n=1 Tax=Candidatus Dojkabacteria bacterium TaxID=2099670 RepID=A0A3M0YZ68_9BACT|nr:MAG: hypothetical protein D6810_01315 [Candidatus Dojkabacteria bacterium]